MSWAFGTDDFDDDLPPIAPTPAINLRRPKMADMRAIGPRQWLYGRDLIIGYTSVIAAPGGTGKSALALAMAMSVASGRPLLALDEAKPRIFDKVYKQGPVVYYGTEDPGSETERRLFGFLLDYGLDIDRDNIDFRHMSARDCLLKVARREGQGLVKGDLTTIVDLLRGIGALLLVVDPLVHVHDASENNNEEMGLVMHAFNEIAERAGCAVLVVHHSRKGHATADVEDADSTRGAVAIGGSARAMLGLKSMSQEEANELGIPKDERRRYIKSGNAKVNMSPKTSEATWYELVSSNLGNATPEYPDGDSVQVVRRWNPRSATLIDQDAVNSMLDAISGGIGRGIYYAAGKGSGERWIGKPISAACPDVGDAKIKAIVDTWLKAGVLTTGECPSPSATNRHKVPCLHVSARTGTLALDALVSAGITARYQ